MRLNRRQFFHRAGALGLTAALARPASAQTPTMRLILLGSSGGPSPKKDVSAPANAIVIGDDLYIIDCGDGVARQAVRANLALPKLRHVFITHHHSDHNADYGTLLLLAWAMGLKTRVDTWGPAPMVKITDLFMQMSAPDIDVRILDEGRPDLRTLVVAHEMSDGGVVMQNEQVKVTAALVDHPMVKPAFGYRFDGPGRSIVFSGDTAVSDRLIALAKGADVLVHEAIWGPAIPRIAAGDTNAATLEKHLRDSHTVAEDCGKVAAAAGVKTLVLSHFVPGGDTSITDEMWANAAKTHFKGQVIVGKDLMEI